MKASPQRASRKERGQREVPHAAPRQPVVAAHGSAAAGASLLKAPLTAGLLVPTTPLRSGHSPGLTGLMENCHTQLWFVEAKGTDEHRPWWRTGTGPGG